MMVPIPSCGVPYESVLDRTEKIGEYVLHVRVRETDAEAYPCGYDYALHYGTTDGETLLRYDNAHERTKGHERHTVDGDERIEFPGMYELVRRFYAEVEELPPEA